MSDPDPDPTRVDQTAITPATSAGPAGGSTPPGGPWAPDTPPPPDRRPWILAALLAVIVAVLLLLLLLQDDDDDGATAGTSTTELTSSTSATTTSTPASTTTTAATTSTSAPVVTVPPSECAEAGGGPATPGLAADTVYQAWVRGDEACAATLTTPAALAELFSRDGAGATDELQGCTEEDVPDPHVDCAFTYEGGSTHYLMNYSDTDGWQVFDITQVAD